MKKIFILFFILFLSPACFAQMTTNNNRRVNQIQVQVDSNTVTIIYLSSTVINLQEFVNSLFGTRQRQYLSGDASLTSAQYFQTSTTPYTTETTATTGITVGTPVIISSWVVMLGNIKSIPSGITTAEFYGSVTGNNTTRLWFEVYDGSGTAMTFLYGTNQSEPMTNIARVEYFVNASTGIIYPKSNMLTFVEKAIKTSGGNTVFTGYRGGQSDANISFPVLLPEVTVTNLTAGANLSVNSNTGDITIRLNNEINLTGGCTVQQRIKTNGIYSGDNGASGDQYMHFTDSDSWGTAGGGGGGGVSLGKHTTGYFVMIAGDSFLADSEFMAIKDNYIQVPTTWTLKNISPFCVYTSTVWVTTYNLALSTEVGNVTVWSKIDTTGFSVPTDVKNGTTKTPDTATVINYNNFLALHISTCAESGSTSNGGIRGEYWYEIVK